MPETQLRTPAIRVAPPQLGTARVLSGVSPNGLARSRRNTGPKPETPFRRSAELDFGFLPVATEVSLVFWTGVFLSPGRRIRVTGKETGPGPGGYG